MPRPPERVECSEQMGKHVSSLFFLLSRNFVALWRVECSEQMGKGHRPEAGCRTCCYMYKFEKTCLKLVFWLFQETLWPYETFVNHSKLRHPLPDCYTPILISKTAK